jgi:hypothetical protein
MGRYHPWQSRSVGPDQWTKTTTGQGPGASGFTNVPKRWNLSAMKSISSLIIEGTSCLYLLYIDILAVQHPEKD